MDAGTITEVAHLAIEANGLPDSVSHRVVALPGTSKIHDLEKFLDYRERFRGTFATSSIDAFARYLEDTLGVADKAVAPPLFVSDTVFVAEAIFNLGDREVPGHADHKAVLSLPRTAAFKALVAAHGNRFSQRELVEFVEDWAPNLRAIAQGEDEASMHLRTVVAAIREVTISKTSEATSSVADFSERKSALDSIEAKAAVGLPAYLDMTCQPGLGMSYRLFRLRVGVLTGGDIKQPQFVLKVIGYEAHGEEIAKDFAETVMQKVGGWAVPHIGTFDPK